jgi:predicted AAA+ superfamily ATPase
MGVSTTRIGYRPRIVDAELSRKLGAVGAVLIEGPRGCGKTSTALTRAASAVRLDVDEAVRTAGLVAPQVLLPGARPRLIDEWQLVPDVWNHVRRAVDDSLEPGQFILTGSAVPVDDATRHTGSLRVARLRMRPMSLAESGHSTRAVSLAALLRGGEPQAADPGLDIHALAERIVIGGWPILIARTPEQAMTALRGYLDETRRVDLARVDGVRRDPINVERVIRSLARNVATAASARSIAADVSGPDGAVDRHTVLGYINALTRVFVVEDLPAWEPALRSRSTLRKARKRHFVDPSLAAAALDARPERLVLDMETLGFLFESLVIRDLRVYAQSVDDAKVYYYRDNTDLEADAVVQHGDRTWAAFEVKLGQGFIDRAATSLLELAKRIDVDRQGEPAALTVITGWGPAYRRPDGVNVVPIGALGP